MATSSKSSHVPTGAAAGIREGSRQIGSQPSPRTGLSHLPEPNIKPGDDSWRYWARRSFGSVKPGDDGENGSPLVPLPSPPILRLKEPPKIGPLRGHLAGLDPRPARPIPCEKSPS